MAGVSLVVAGIDEAGYGPLLGPLCIGFSAFRIGRWQAGEAAPDLWELMSTGVCRKPGDKQRRVAVEDSKKLKLANSSQKHHPVAHLERGVLAFLAAAGDEQARIAADLELFETLCAACEGHAWYAGEARPLPVGHSPQEIGIAANEVRRAAHGAGVEMLAIRCRAVGEAQFNDVVERAGTKAAATELAIGSYLRGAWERWAAEPDRAEGGPRVVCDRQGGKDRLRTGSVAARARRDRQRPRGIRSRLPLPAPRRRPRDDRALPRRSREQAPPCGAGVHGGQVCP